MFFEYKAISRTGKVNKIRRTGWVGGRKTLCAAEGSHAGQTGQAAQCLQTDTSPLSAEIHVYYRATIRTVGDQKCSTTLSPNHIT